MKLFVMFIMLLCMSILLGCSRFVSEPIKNIVKKTYIAIAKAELVIQNISSENVFQNTKKLELPLFLAKTALNLINSKINNPEVNIEIDKALSAIDTALILIKDATPNNIEQMKTELEIYVIELKSAVENAAKYLKIELPTVSSLATSNEECIKELDKATVNLQKLLN